MCCIVGDVKFYISQEEETGWQQDGMEKTTHNLKRTATRMQEHTESQDEDRSSNQEEVDE